MPNPLTLNEKVAFLEAFAKAAFTDEPDHARSQDLHQQLRNVVARVVAHPKKREVDCLFSDFSEMCRHSPVAVRKTLSSELLRKVGLALSYFEHARLARIDRIVERGKIRTDDEWRLLEERVQELCEEEKFLDCEVLNRLLAEY